MTSHRVGPKGQVVIPKAMRDALGLAPGDEVAFELDGDRVLVRSAEGSLDDLLKWRGALKGFDLDEMRREDREIEREHEEELMRLAGLSVSEPATPSRRKRDTV